MAFQKLHIKSTSFRMLLIFCCIVLTLLVTDYHLADTGRSKYFKSSKFPHGVRPISLSDKVKLFVDSSDVILAGNFLGSKRFDTSDTEHKIEYILEYAHSKDSLIVKYIDYNNNIHYIALEKTGDSIAFQEIHEGHSALEKTKLKKDSFKYTSGDSSFDIIALLHFAIYLTVFIYLVLILIKYRKTICYLITYCIILILLYLYIDYQGGLQGANISTYHILHPKNAIELDFREIPPTPYSFELCPIKSSNIFLNTTMLDSNYIFSFFFLKNGVITQYYDDNTHDIRYAYLQSSSISEEFDEDFAMIIEDLIISLFVGKWYDIDIKSIEIDEVYQKLSTKHKTLWINRRDIYSAWICRNFIKLGLKLLFFIALYYIIKHLRWNIHNRKFKCP